VKPSGVRSQLWYRLIPVNTVLVPAAIAPAITLAAIRPGGPGIMILSTATVKARPLSKTKRSCSRKKIECDLVPNLFRWDKTAPFQSADVKLKTGCLVVSIWILQIRDHTSRSGWGRKNQSGRDPLSFLSSSNLPQLVVRASLTLNHWNRETNGSVNRILDGIPFLGRVQHVPVRRCYRITKLMGIVDWKGLLAKLESSFELSFDTPGLHGNLHLFHR
jgi:hypothetical protein